MIPDPNLGLLVVLAGAAILALVISNSSMRRDIRRLIVTGLVLRVVGSMAYLYLINRIYGGGDYIRFFGLGLEYADIVLAGNPEAMLEPWTRGVWWGTPFVSRTAGLLVAILGPTLPGLFIVFAVAAYGGLVAIGFAFARAFPSADFRRYLMWIVFFPALWFWPSALGKDAVVLCGIGLATMGFVEVRSLRRWLWLALGVALVFAIRPQVAAVLVFAMVAAQWLGERRRWRVRNLAQGLLLAAAGVAVITLSSGAIGVELFNPDEVEVYLQRRADLSRFGGSSLEGGTGSMPPWLAPVNVLLRPFPWEISGVPTLLASAEIFLLWGMVWHRRRDIRRFVRVYRHTRLFWMALIFSFGYAVALGMSLSNMGMIVRQRIHILPFLLMIIAGAPRRRRSARPSPIRRSREIHPARPV